jgi:putative photosynthetic complex assembly protein
MDHVARRPDPLRKPAIAFGCLVGMAVLFAAFGPKAVLPDPRAGSAVAETRALSFLDEADGGVIVVDAETGAQITRLGVGEGGFVRSTMRSLARDRTLRRIPRDPPFMLERLTDGTLLLGDPETGATVRLGAFGEANAAAFAAFLDQGRGPT